MANETPFNHLLKTPGGFYFYDVNKNAILRIDKDIFETLFNITEMVNETNCYASRKTEQKIEKFKQDGLLSSRRVKEIIHPVSDVLEYYLSSKLNMMTLQVTQQCNFRCDYCVYSGGYQNRSHSSKKMEIETAKKGIDFLLRRSFDNDSVNIGFYGGEPLLEFEFIKECVLYAIGQGDGRKITFSMTTNGTLLTPEIVAFLEAHDISLTISLDGPREIHDKNRRFAANGCGTFEAVIKKIEMITSQFPSYLKKISFNAVLDPVNDFKCVNDFFVNYDLISEIPLMSSEISDRYIKNDDLIILNEKYYEHFNYQYFLVLLSAIGKIDKSKTSRIIQNYFASTKRDFQHFSEYSDSLPDRCHHGGPCIPGVQRLFMDVDGFLFPCERVSEMSKTVMIGHIDTGFDIQRVRKLLNIGKISEDYCKNCWSFRYCKLCAAFADDMNDLSCAIKISHCKTMRQNVENLMKDYCVLTEFGYIYEDDNDLYMYKD